MSKIRCWVIILLLLFVLIFIGLNLVNMDDMVQLEVNFNDFMYKSEYIDIVVYSLEGVLSYWLIVEYVEYFFDQEVFWFIKLVMIIFDINKVFIWLVRVDKVKLMNDWMFYFYGYVEVNVFVLDF